MLVDSDRIVPITRLQKELTQTIRELSETGDPIFILKNNNMEAVIVPFEEYKRLIELQEMYEYFETNEMIKNRMKNYDPEKTISWESIKE